MKVPSAPSVGYQPERAQPLSAPRTEPQGNARPEQIVDLGRATEDVGGTMLEIDKELQKRVNMTRAKEADAKIADVTREMLFSPQGYRSLIGRNALDAREDTIKQLDDARQRVLGTLTPDQRALLSSSDEARYQRARSVIDGHYAEQADAYDLATTEARADALMNDALEARFAPTKDKAAASEPGDQKPDSQRAAGAGASSFDENRAGMRRELRELAARRGLGPEQTKKLLQKADDNLYGGVVERLLRTGHAQDARDELAKAPVSAEKRTDLQRGLDVAIVKEQGSNLARALSFTPGTLLDKVNLLVSMHAEGHIEVDNPNAVFAEALQNLTQHDKLISAEMARQKTAAWDEIERHAQITRGHIDVEHEMLIDRAGLREQYQLWSAQGRQFITTDVGHYALTVMTPKELRQKFATEDELKKVYYNQLSTEGWGHLRARWQQGNEDMPKLDKSIVYADGLRDAIGLKKGDKVDKDLFDRWKNNVDLEVRKLMKAKPGTAEEDHWAPAMEAAMNHGFFVSEKGAVQQLGTQRRLFIQEESAERGGFSGTMFLRQPGAMLPTGQRAPDQVQQANLTEIVPGTGLTAHEAAILSLKAEGIPNPTVNEVVSRAYKIRDEFTMQRRETGKQRLGEMFNEEYRNIVGAGIALEGPTTTEAAPATREKAAAARLGAMQRVQARSGEWEHYGLTGEEALTAMGWGQTDRAQQAFDYLMRVNQNKPEKVSALLRNPHGVVGWIQGQFGLDDAGMKQLATLAEGKKK